MLMFTQGIELGIEFIVGFANMAWTSKGTIMSDEAFNRQRRSLNIVSIALIVYFATGVEIGQDTSFLTITIKYEVVAYTLVWIAFFYFWWRFHLYGEDVRRRWKMAFLYELSKKKKFRSLYRQPESDDQNDNMVWAPSLHGEGFRRYLMWDEAYLVGLRDDDGQIQFADSSTFSDSINPVTQRWSVGPETVIPIIWWKYWLPALKANVSAIKNKSGTEWALPNFLAVLALICGISSLIIKVI